MIGTLLLISAGIIIVAISVLFFSPLRINVCAGFSVFELHGTAGISFFHPRLISLYYDFASKKKALRILGRQWGRKVSSDRPEGSFSGPSGEDNNPVSAELPSPDTNDTSLPSDNEPQRTSSRNDEDAAFAPDNGDGTAGREKNEGVDDTVIPPSGNDGDPSSPFHGQSPEEQTSLRSHPPDSEKPLYHQSSTGKAGKPVTSEPVQPPNGIDTSTEEPGKEEKETAADSPVEKDNWLKRLQRNRYVYFLKNSRWRNKVLRWFIRVVRLLLRIVVFDRFRFSVRAGNENPMLVGVLFGLYEGIRSALPMRKPYIIEFEPVFMDNCFEGEVRFRTTTSLFRVLFPVGTAILTFPLLHSLRLGWRYYRAEKRRKRTAMAL